MLQNSLFETINKVNDMNVLKIVPITNIKRLTLLTDRIKGQLNLIHLENLIIVCRI